MRRKSLALVSSVVTLAGIGAVPAARPGPADGFLRATRFDGRKVAGGWNPPALRPAWARRPR
jgi:hypothetical protein